jgi:hypothetical protein
MHGKRRSRLESYRLGPAPSGLKGYEFMLVIPIMKSICFDKREVISDEFREQTSSKGEGTFRTT